MSEPQNQISKRQIVYYPPKSKVIEEYARQVCKQLGFSKTEEINDFAELVKTLVAIKLKQLNQPSHQVDRGVSHAPQIH